MILAFCLRSPEDSRALDDRFGRCAAFAFVDSESGEVRKIVENEGRDAVDAAGTSAVQLLVNGGAAGAVAPHLGPKADEARRRLGLRIWSQGSHAATEEALAAWKAGALEESGNAPAPRGLRRA